MACLAPRRVASLGKSVAATPPVLSAAAAPAALPPVFASRVRSSPAASPLLDLSAAAPWAATLPTPDLPRLESSTVRAPVSTTTLTADPHQRTVNSLHEELQREYQLNVGRAIDAVRADVQSMFDAEPDLTAFTEDVALTDRSGSVLLRGKSLYSGLYASLRLAKRLTMSQPHVRVLNVRFLDWTNEISVRFSVVTPGPLGIEPLHFDAVSVYKLNEKGLICEHRVDDVFRNHFFNKQHLLNQFAFPIQNVAWGPSVAGI